MRNLTAGRLISEGHMHDRRALQGLQRGRRAHALEGLSHPQLAKSESLIGDGQNEKGHKCIHRLEFFFWRVMCFHSTMG
jgi:hypothetical protein